MLDETFAASLLSARAGYRVFGLKLRPFCFWHAFLLEAIESPFTGADKPFSFANLYLAARICRLRYPGRSFRSLRARIEQKFIAYRYGYVWSRNRSFRLAQLNTFSAYIANYCENRPIYVESENDPSPPLKSPWYLVGVMQLLRSGTCSTPAAAWNFPLGLSAWASTAAAEARGGKIDILRPEDRAQLQGMGIEL